MLLPHCCCALFLSSSSRPTISCGSGWRSTLWWTSSPCPPCLSPYTWTEVGSVSLPVCPSPHMHPSQYVWVWSWLCLVFGVLCESGEVLMRWLLTGEVLCLAHLRTGRGVTCCPHMYTHTHMHTHTLLDAKWEEHLDLYCVAAYLLCALRRPCPTCHCSKGNEVAVSTGLSVFRNRTWISQLVDSSACLRSLLTSSQPWCRG